MRDMLLKASNESLSFKVTGPESLEITYSTRISQIKWKHNTFHLKKEAIDDLKKLLNENFCFPPGS